MYTNSLGQYFDNLSLNAASCQTTDRTIFVFLSIEPELKDLKITSSLTCTKNQLELRNITKMRKKYF